MLFHVIDVKGCDMSVCDDGDADDKGEYESGLAMIQRNRFGAVRVIKSQKDVIAELRRPKSHRTLDDLRLRCRFHWPC